MPGIAGMCEAAAEHGALDGALETMLRRMARGSQALARAATSSNDVALGWVGRDAQPATQQTATSGGCAIVLDGELYGTGANGGPQFANGVATHAQRLLHGYMRGGETFLAELEGRFAAAIWDGNRQQCVLITDKFGSKPLYYNHGGGRLAFASEIKALLALSGTPRNLNIAGLVQFFAFGHLWNQDTFFSSIECLDSATTAVFDLANSAFHRNRYWRPKSTGRRGEAESLVDLDVQLKSAVDDRTLGSDHIGVSLSGGLDARTVLGLMEHGSTPATCVSLGMEGSLDQLSARRLAELAGCEFHTFVLGEGFLSAFEKHLQDMVDLTDGHYLSQCIVMPTLPLYEKLGVRTLLRGHAGELVHMHKAYNFSVDRSVHAIRNQQMLHEWLFPRLQSHLTDGVSEPLLCGVDQQGFASIAHESLRTALDDTAHWEHPVDRIGQLFLDQRMHRETAMSLAKIGSVVDVRVPYLDGRFVDAVFAAPIELRIGERIQTYMLQKRRPDFLRPPNSNTGAPVGASAARRAFCYYRMKVLAKLGVKGYQPYERLGLWLRRELKPVVEGLLLRPECLDRGVLEPDAVRSVVRRHLSGEQNHTFLLLAMMILETGFRRILDQSAGDSTPPGLSEGRGRAMAEKAR